MALEENIKIVKLAYKAFSEGDIPALVEYFTDDIDWILPEIKHITPSGKRKGKKQVTEFFGLLAAHLDYEHFEPKEFVAQNDKVIVIGYVKAKVRNTGRSAECDWIHAFTIKDHKI